MVRMEGVCCLYFLCFPLAGGVFCYVRSRFSLPFHRGCRGSKENSTVRCEARQVGDLFNGTYERYFLFLFCIFPLASGVFAQDSLFLFVVVAEGACHIGMALKDYHPYMEMHIKSSFDIDECKQIMASPVVVLKSVEAAGDLCQILLSITHNSFPVGKLTQV